ncbi:MAG: signal recognition particle-docking protein FtsY [Deltaproteobacteria bacterium]|nr:signal recognition particle-docking protein FtsY [Deltaproteobacteria bacterium]
MTGSQLSEFLLGLIGQSEKADAGSDAFAIGALVLVLLFLAWLVIAVVRKLTGKTKFADVKEDQEEATRTARLWAEAKRRGEDDEEDVEDEKEEEKEEEQEAIQDEMLEKAREQREARWAQETAARETRQEALKASTEKTKEQEPPKAPPIKEPTLKKPREEEVKETKTRSLEDGLKRTREGFVSKLTHMFGRKTLGEDELEEIEELLFTADIGVRTAQKLLDYIQDELSGQSPDKMIEGLKSKIQEMLHTDAAPLDIKNHSPFVILVVGVNGTGKTTTIGKLAMKYSQAGNKVVLAAADTFRAAAEEQLTIWAERANVEIVRAQHGADPGSVVFDAINRAKTLGADIVIADTAGRLHTKKNLIEELKKVHRVCGKALDGAPHEVLLVLDATTGQNAINQAKQFDKALKVSGIVLTKLDGTAKGGVIIGIADTFRIPVRYIGIGEQAEDLRPFDADQFVKALFT